MEYIDADCKLMVHKCQFYMVKLLRAITWNEEPHLPVGCSVVRTTAIVLANQLADGQEPHVLWRRLRLTVKSDFGFYNKYFKTAFSWSFFTRRMSLE